jgi:ABC-2 type transport system ATP-binding protein
VLALVGLTDAGRRAVGGYSLGMRQRLALAAALLGDPPVLVLDEPANGLDPEGIAWMRGLLRDLADQGRTVLVSSHVLSEVQQLVDEVVIVNKGRLVRQGRLADLAGQHTTVVVRTPQADTLTATLAAAGAHAGRAGVDELRVTGMDVAEVGERAFAAGVRLHGLAIEASDLEQVFLALTADGDADLVSEVA